jgi:hypothetical protein
MKRLLIALAVVGAFQPLTLGADDHIPNGYKLLYEQTFESPESIREFQMSDAKAWKYSKEEKGGALELAAQSEYKPEVRSPVNIALIKDKVFGDFILEADLVQTGKEYGHRDMCLFFGFQNPKQFYYTHMATKADPNAHNVFIVNNEPRKNFAKTTTTGVNWGLNIWHKVRLERKLADGTIKVYFDDMTIPIMVAEDKTFGAGFIGFGSFDDTGKVDNVKIWGPKAEEARPVPSFENPSIKAR